MDGKPPQSFEIKNDYCLNSFTLKQYLENMGSVESNIENLSVSDLESSDEPPYYKCFLSLK